MTKQRTLKSSAVNRRRAVFTIVSANYIGYAATLMQSVAKYLIGVERFIILCDTATEFPDVDLSATMLDCDHLNIPYFENMKKWYSVIELNTAIKPFAFLHFFGKLVFDEVCYIDPDILLFSEMTEVFAALKSHTCVLTPHMMRPLQDGKEPSDLTIMKSGIYNLGFLGLRNDNDGRALARWWADRCFLHCRVDIAGNMFTDQRWMDLAPAFVRRAYILQHPGYNVAYWNLLHRTVKKAADGKWFVNGKRLVFFHFSGISPDKPAQFSKHQNRYSPDNLGPVNEACDLYRSLVLRNRWQQYSKCEYGFGRFHDGRRIDDVMRHWIIRAVDEKLIDPKGKLQFESDFFDCPEESVREKDVIITRYMYQFWLDRRDLRAAFDIFTAEGLQHYFGWFLGGDAEAQGVDACSISKAQKLREGGVPTQVVIPMQLPPWPRVSCEVWAERSTEALTGLAQDIDIQIAGTTVRMPKQFALLWERRRDLQSAFDLAVPERVYDYLCWALTNGAIERGVDLDLVSTDFVHGFCKVSSISAHYGDVPITEGMILVRRADLARELLAGWQRFPVERSGRLAHGLWFALIAPRLFNWPGPFVAPVRDYFHAATSTSADGFSLNRAALAVWELRPDLQGTFPLGDRLSVWRFLRWLLTNGLQEFGLTIEAFDARLRSFLLSESPRFPGVTQLLEMLHDHRPDLRELFDLSTDHGRRKLNEWSELHLRPETEALPLGEALAPTTVSPEPAGRKLHRATIALTGYWSAPSGRGEDVRGSVQALDAVCWTDYVVVDLETHTLLQNDGTKLPPGIMLEVEVNILHTNADTAMENAQALRRLGVRSQRSIGFWAWELEWLPNYWRHAYSFYDEIWASTRFAEAAFNRDALRPVRHVPMVVAEPATEARMSRSDLDLPDDATLFVFMFDFRSYAARKNPEAVVRAFLAAFPDLSEPAYLLIKTSGAAAMPADAARLRDLARDRRIEIRDAILDRPQLLELVRSADAFVSLHRSEGFGRGPAEAMLLGTPAIVTNYSGSTDYATDECALLVDFDLIPVAETDYPGVTGQRWAEARIPTAARHMRWVHEHQADARALGRQGQSRIRGLYGPRSVGDAMIRAMGLSAPSKGQPNGLEALGIEPL